VSEPQPAAVQPVTAEPVTADRVTVEPAAVQPVTAEPVTADRVTAEQVQVFEDEVSDATRYERGLAVKCLACLLLVAIILALRVYFFG
jgi:hypothetical protein